MEKLTPLMVRKDDRGTLTHIITFNGIDLNKFEVKEGHIVGGHFHKLTHEVFHVISGLVSVFSAPKGAKEAIIKEYKPGESFTIGPYDWHYVQAVSDSTLIVLLEPPYDKDCPDVYEGKSLEGIN